MNLRTSAALFLRSDAHDSDNPFNGDLFDRRNLAAHLTGYLNRLPHGGVIAIDAAWGDGKTWFVQNWRDYLIKEDISTIYLDAFARDYVDDPFVMISGELLNSFENIKETTKKKFTKKAIEVMKVVGEPAIKTLGAVAGAAFGINALGAYADIAKAIQDGTTSAINDAIKKRIIDYEKEKSSIESFKTTLSELVQECGGQIVLIIDELDRCRPDFSVKTIERIKHFFDVPGVVFVLAVNYSQLAASIKGVYGESIDAVAYLGKFIQLSLTLPKLTGNGALDHNRMFLETCLARIGLNGSDGIEFATALAHFAKFFGMPLRDMERAVSLYSLAQPMRIGSMAIAFPIALKLARPSIYSSILRGDIDGVRQAIKILEAIKRTESSELVHGLLQAHQLFEVDQPSVLDNEGMAVYQAMGGPGRRAKDVIMYFYSRVDFPIK
ncbi:KAP family P-loop NTPase fold protein [Burkholderia ambifaria]|uniref:KAP family P-loop NTPase fold protein n=1 Tax=Burkholderia ambifaria TaxID=152480 RepID=UPI001588BEF1|nr:P-loop NTPase fold protein [Burkholderia ambifaria]